MAYVKKVENKANLSRDELDEVLRTHLVDPELLRADEMSAFFEARREEMCKLIERAIGKQVPRDVSSGLNTEDSSHFEVDEL